MRTTLLYSLLLLLSLFSLFGLFFLESTYQLQHATLRQCIGNVAFEGIVVSHDKKETFSILTLKDASFFPVIVFDNQEFIAGQRVGIKGTFQEYRGQPQLVAGDIRVFS